MGGLHIEQIALKAHGTMLKGTGIQDVIKQAGLKTIGLETAAADVNGIKKARYTLQILAVCLYRFLKSAYLDDDSHHGTIDQWALQQDRVMFKYWYGILNHEINVLMLVRSF